MRRFIMPLVTAVIVASIILAGCVPGAAPPEGGAPPEEGVPAPEAPAPEAELPTYRWRLQAYPGPFPAGYEDYIQDFCDSVRTMSEGRLDITRYFAGELVPTEEILHGVGAGTVEMGYSAGLWFPAIDVGGIETGLPMAFSNLDEALVFFEAKGMGFEELCREAYAEQNAYYLGPSYEDRICLLTTTPVNTLDDLKKLKIFAEGDIGRLLSDLGVAVVTVSWEEAPMALATGMIDGTISTGVYGYGMYGYTEYAKYYLDDPFCSPVVCHYIVNMDAWNSLPDDLKEILSEAQHNAGLAVRRLIMMHEYADREPLGIQLTHLPPEDIATLTEGAMGIWDEAAAQSPRCAQAIDMLKELNRNLGRIE